MAEWFQAKVKFLRQMDNGLIKKVSETYLVDSNSFTETEARVLEENQGASNIACQTIARSNIKEVVFYGDTAIWFKVKVQYTDIEETTEKEKRFTLYLLVNAQDAKEAIERTQEHLKHMLVPFSIPKVEESPIVDVFEYQKQAPQQFKPVEGSRTIVPTMLDTGCDMHTAAVEASNPANGKPHEFEVPDESIDTLDQINSIFDFDLSTAQVQRIADQCRKLDANEFRTWLVAAHGATPWQVSRVIEICAANS